MSNCVSMIEDNASDIGELKKCKGREDEKKTAVNQQKKRKWQVSWWWYTTLGGAGVTLLFALLSKYVLGG